MFTSVEFFVMDKEAQANMEETDGERLPWVELTTVDPQERSTWRSGVRSAMLAASQLPGRGPTDVDDAPAPACWSKIWLWYVW